MIKAVFDDEDNLLKCKHDTKNAWNMIKSHFEVETRQDMLEHCYGRFQKSFYAKLCQKMSVSAVNGDELCQEIFIDAGHQLAKMIIALIPRVDPKLFDNGHLNILCVGSVWLSWDLLKPGLLEELNEGKIPFGLSFLKLKPNVSMAFGAMYLAADSVKFSLPRDYSQNHEIFFNYSNQVANIKD